MFSFDSELDNVTGNNKGGDWKNRSDMELKAFHNEEDGQMYANMESVTGTFNIFWNFVYTGTPYALGRKVTQRNFGNGLASRLAVIPMPDAGIASRNQKRDAKAKEVLAEWAERLDKVEGELPIEPLNDETYEWQSSHLEIAEFNGDKADRTLLKRVRNQYSDTLHRDAALERMAGEAHADDGREGPPTVPSGDGDSVQVSALLLWRDGTQLLRRPG